MSEIVKNSISDSSMLKGVRLYVILGLERDNVTLGV